MRILKILPFLLIPIPVVLLNKCNNDPDSEKLAVASTLNVKNTVAVNELTQEELKALEYLETFLKRYTSNGKLNYGTMYRLIEGLKRDYKTVNKEGKNMSGLEGMAARAYPNNLLKSTYYKVQKEVDRRARIEMISDFKDFGVDPQTEEKVDDAPIENYVTKPELLEYRKSSYLFKAIIERDLPQGKKVIFKEGVNIDAIKFVKERKKGLPSGAEVVDVSRLTNE